MLSRWVRTWDSRVFRPFLAVLSRAGVKPNGLTLASLYLYIGAGVLFGFGRDGWSVSLLVIGGICDVLDGELARFTGASSAYGSFLDSICDHLGDLAITLGFVWRFIEKGNTTGILLAFLAMFGSVFNSQVRSRAGMLGIDTKETGLFTRLERTLVLILGILFRQYTLAFGVLAFFNLLSALQRMIHTSGAVRKDAARVD